MFFEDYLPGIYVFLKNNYLTILSCIGILILLKLREFLIMLVFIADATLYFRNVLKFTAVMLGIFLFILGLRIPVLSNLALPAAIVTGYVAFCSYPYFILKEAVRRYLYEHKHIEAFTHDEKIERGYTKNPISTIYDLDYEDYEIIFGDSDMDTKEEHIKLEVQEMDEKNCLEYFDKFKGA